ncbi:MAG: thioredoxin family protein [Bacteroidota bacterium]
MNQMQPFYLPLLLCLASLFATPSQLVSQGYGNGVHFFEGSLQQLQTEAETQQRPYLISVYTNWCDPCQDLNNRTFTDVSLSQFINSNYLVYRLNPEYQINRSDGDLLTQYDITFYPTLLIFDANGQLMHKLSGYQSPEDLHWVLEEMLPEIPFSQPQQTASATTLLMEESAESEEDYPLFASADDGNNQLMILDQYEEAPVYDQLSSPTETDFTEPMIRDRRIGFLADDSAPAIAEAKIEEAPSPSEDLFLLLLRPSVNTGSKSGYLQTTPM